MIVKGKTAYFGPTDKINSYFKTIGITIPLKTNTADFIVDLTQDNKENAVTMFDNSPKKKITSAQTDSVKSLSFEKIKSVSNDLVVTDLESSPPPSRKTSLQKRPDVKIQIRDTKTRITSTIRDLPPISSQFHGIFQAKPSDSFNKTIDVVNLPEKYLKSTLYKDAMEELGLIENNSHPIIISLAIDSHESIPINVNFFNKAF